MDGIIETMSRFSQTMAFTRTYGLSGTGERILARLVPASVRLSDVIEGDFRLPFGSSIAIQETVTISTSIIDFELVDADVQWYNTKYYIGSWEIIEEFGTPSGTQLDAPKPSDGFGFISSLSQQIRFSTTYLVRGLATGFPFEFARIDLNQCNFALQPFSPAPGQPGLPGFIPQIDDGLFKGQASIGELPVLDPFLNTRSEILGLYIKPGVRLDTVRQTISSKPYLNIDLPPARSPLCNLGSDCDTEFDAFVRSINAGQPIDDYDPVRNFGVFSSNSSNCNNLSAGNCQPSTFTCTNGEIREYWTPSGN